MADITLYIGNKNYSSWSLRAWLMMRRLDQEFEEVVIPLREKETHEMIQRFSPSGKVPVLHHRGHVIWDSLAIAEFLAQLAGGYKYLVFCRAEPLHINRNLVCVNSTANCFAHHGRRNRSTSHSDKLYIRSAK